MTFTMNKEWEGAEGTKFWPILLMVVHNFWESVLSFCDVSYIYLAV